jgi:hypothetical protein
MMPYPTTLGTFSKSAGGVHCSYSRCGGCNCDVDACWHNQDNTDPDADHSCYGPRFQTLRPTLMAKLQRHERMGAARVSWQAADELKWAMPAPTILRISAFGSLPNEPTPEDIVALRALLKAANARAIPIHCPIEGHVKSLLYRGHVGDLCTVRESLTGYQGLATDPGPVSFVCGRPGMTRVDCLQLTRDVCKTRTAATGRRCVVCPAIAATFRHRAGLGPSPRCKCGFCLVCCRADIDVGYPHH